MFFLLEILLLLLLLLVFISIHWYMTIPNNLPPGPIGLPLLGSSLDYWDGVHQRSSLLKNIKKYGPILKIYIANKLVIVLGDYEVIHEALVKQGDKFVGRPQMYAMMPKKLHHYGLLLSEGDLWKEHRRFALSTLRDFGVGRPIVEPRIKEEAEYLSDRIAEFGKTGLPFNPKNLITCAVSNIINQLVFGRRFSYDDQEFVEQLTTLTNRVSASGVSFLSPFMLSDIGVALVQWLPVVRQIRRDTLDFVDYVEREMKLTMATFDSDQEPTNYIHAYMKAASNNNGSHAIFTNIQLLTICCDLFMAGSESTATTIRWAVLYLAHHQDVQERMYQEIKSQLGTDALASYADRLNTPYAEAVIMETQRLADLLPLGVARRTNAPIKLMGYDIPEGAIIVPFLNNISHNPQIYADPMSFKPERFLDSNGKVIRDPRLIPFQTGKRVCLGEPLARMELFMFLVGIVSRFRFSFPHGKDRPSMEPVVGFTCTPVPFEVCVEKRID